MFRLLGVIALLAGIGLLFAGFVYYQTHGLAPVVFLTLTGSAFIYMGISIIFDL